MTRSKGFILRTRVEKVGTTDGASFWPSASAGTRDGVVWFAGIPVRNRVAMGQGQSEDKQLSFPPCRLVCLRSGLGLGCGCGPVRRRCLESAQSTIRDGALSKSGTSGIRTRALRSRCRPAKSISVPMQALERVKQMSEALKNRANQIRRNRLKAPTPWDGEPAPKTTVFRGNRVYGRGFSLSPIHTSSFMLRWYKRPSA